MTLEDIHAISQCKDVADAKRIALQAMLDKTRNDLARAAARAKVNTFGDLLQVIQWAWNLHLQGQFPDPAVVKTRHGIGYRR